MEDLINRRDAIEVIEKMMEVYWDRKVVLARAWEQINGLPSVNLQPTCNQLATNLQPIATDCISRQAAIDAIDEIESEVADGDGFQYEKWRQYFCDLPSADVSEMNVGKWLEKEVIHAKEAKTMIIEWQSCKCSVCGCYDTRPYLYCFNEPRFCSWCGAEMKGVSDE